MLKIFKQPKLPATLFVTASLAALILLPVFFTFLKSILIEDTQTQSQQTSDNIFDTSDPYITKVPSLRDMIDGPITDGIDPSFGNNNAPIVIVEFSDFECGFCQGQEEVINEILSEYDDKIRLIWKDYPENNIASPSYRAAIAARCAQKQEQFWPYHDLLFEESYNLNSDTFSEIAQELNLNLNQFEECLESDEVKSLINDNILEANALDINGVPFIYVNKQEILGEVTAEELKKIIELELNKK
jgi:protein-disulfide isomerase